MLLKTLAVVAGLVAALWRLPAVISPEFGRKMIKVLLVRRGITLFLMVIVAVLGSVFVWAFRLYLNASVAPVPPAAWVLLGFGVLMTVMGLLGLINPRLMFTLMSKFYVIQSSTLRALAGLGVIVGLAIAWLGWFLPPPR